MITLPAAYFVKSITLVFPNRSNLNVIAPIPSKAIAHAFAQGIANLPPITAIDGSPTTFPKEKLNI